MFQSTPNSIGAVASPQLASPAAGMPGHGNSAELSHEFSSVMSGLVPSAPAESRQSLAGQLIRVPAAVCDQVMASLQKPAPAGMSIEESMRFSVQKQVDLNQTKILTNLAAAVVRTLKKDVDVLMNSK